MKSRLPKKNLPKKLIKSTNLFPVVGIGASAGGLDAFKKLIKAIPENSGIAYVLVQHLDPNHESMLPEILQKVTSIPVLEITDDMKVRPNHIYVIPSNKMMVATDGVLLLTPRPVINKTERNLPIDLFFKSLAEVHQSHAIGVVLSGTASDGTLGLKAIKDHGGITFAQDEESAAYDGMPLSAVQAGVVDFIMSPEKIPNKLLEVTKIINFQAAVEQNLPLGDEEAFRQILSLLYIRKGTDFKYYKQTTIQRRILRRMALNQNATPATYLKYLRENKSEQDAVYQDLLIPVTSFFRDKKSFEYLCDTVFPLILKSKIDQEPIRVWVAGCSTGEEAYSVAISFKEFLDKHISKISGERAQIFATDLSEPAIAKARLGIYTKIELAGISPKRLNDFFTKTNGSYQVKRELRDMCVFACHNFVKDPPFGKMDLISCRNVLIYMETYLQKKALTTFHYSLNPKGFLLLGKSETISGVPNLFASATNSDKLFTRKDVPGRFMFTTSPRSEQYLQDQNVNSKKDTMRPDFQKTADDIILSKYTPAGVVVNEALDIVHFRGSTSSFLEQSTGKPSHNLLVMAKHDLAFELRNIVHKVKKVKASVIKENIPMQVNETMRTISIEALPLPNTIEPHYLILFHDSNLISNKSAVSNKKTTKSKENDKDLRIHQLEHELVQAREDMRTITEDQEASNEELQSANEELLSGSEELQSLNEELETSKEELQSTNEELTVVNQEIMGLNEQIGAAKNYSESIVANIREPLLVLDKNLRIKTANEAFYKTFRVKEEETEGILIYDLGNKQWNIPKLRTLLEKILPEKSVFIDFEVTHNFPTIGELVMLLNAREIINKNNTEKLILLSIEDITAKVAAKKIIEESNRHYYMMLMQSPFAFSIMKGNKMVITLANDLMKNFWGKGKKIEGKPLLEVLPELENQPFFAMINSVYTTGKPVHANEILARLKRKGNIEERYFNIVYQPHFEADKTLSGVITIAYEVTEMVLARKKVEESEERFQGAVAAVEGILWTNNEKGEMEGEQPGWASLTGQRFEEYQGYGWSKAVHPDDEQPTLDAWNEAVRERKNFVYEHRIRIKNSTWGQFSVKAIPLFNSEGMVREWVGVHTNITEQRQLEKTVFESERRFKQLAELLPQKVWTADAQGNKTYFNQTLLSYVGLTFEELKGGGWKKIIHPHDWKLDEKRWNESVRTGSIYQSESRFLRRDGIYLWHLTLAVPLKNEQGKIITWIGSKTEIQEQRKQKEELEKSISKRTFELKQANKLLEEKNEELVTMNKELEAFAYVSSHDLQEPLRKIQTFAGLILEKENENLTERGKNHFSLIQTSANRMQTLIKDLLAFSHINNTTRKFVNTDLNIIIDLVKAELKDTIKEKHAIIETLELCPANIIAFQFQQLMLNLIGNSLKFSKPNVPPHIIIKSKIIKGSKIKNSLLSPELNYCHITLSDNGIGFEKEYSEKIFEVFQRLHSKEEYAGTGIGLAIVKKIVDNHNGVITATSKLNKGSIFDVYIPAD